MTCYKCRHEFCWECLCTWKGSCSAPKFIHESIRLLNNDIWGNSVPTRVVSKSVGIPLLCVLGCGVGGVAIGVGVGAVSIAASGLIAVSPVAAGIYLYHNPPRVVRNLYSRFSKKLPTVLSEEYFRVQHGVKILLPWVFDNPQYIKTLGGEVSEQNRNRNNNSNNNNNQNQSFMGINGRRSGSIFIGYINPPATSGIPPFIGYFIPSSCPADEINELHIPYINEMITVEFPSEHVPYSDLREEDEGILPEIFNRIQLDIVRSIM